MPDFIKMRQRKTFSVPTIWVMSMIKSITISITSEMPGLIIITKITEAKIIMMLAIFVILPVLLVVVATVFEGLMPVMIWTIMPVDAIIAVRPLKVQVVTIIGMPVLTGKIASNWHTTEA